MQNQELSIIIGGRPIRIMVNLEWNLGHQIISTIIGDWGDENDRLGARAR